MTLLIIKLHLLLKSIAMTNLFDIITVSSNIFARSNTKIWVVFLQPISLRTMFNYGVAVRVRVRVGDFVGVRVFVRVFDGVRVFVRVNVGDGV